MKLLAIETTERVGTLAAACDGNLLADLSLDSKIRSAQSLAPGMKRLLEKVGWRAPDVDLVAVTIGPGSFTGLRVGVVAAKTFAYAAEADILGIGTLDAIAAGAPPDVAVLSAAVDAQRGQVVAGTFRRAEDGWFSPDGPPRLLDIDDWLDRLPPRTPVIGPVLKKLAGRLPKHVRCLDAQFWTPTAVTVAKLAARYYMAGRRDDLWTLAPHYWRPSAAEEKWAGRVKKSHPDGSPSN